MECPPGTLGYLSSGGLGFPSGLVVGVDDTLQYFKTGHTEVSGNGLGTLSHSGPAQGCSKQYSHNEPFFSLHEGFKF